MKTKHLIILGLGSSEKLGNVQSIEHFVKKLIHLVGMQLLDEPKVYDVELDIRKLNRVPFEDEGGITSQLVGYATLSTSHVAIHTWPLRDEFHMDLYSCRYFDEKFVRGFVNDYFNCYKMKVTDVTGAVEW